MHITNEEIIAGIEDEAELEWTLEDGTISVEHFEIGPKGWAVFDSRPGEHVVIETGVTWRKAIERAIETIHTMR